MIGVFNPALVPQQPWQCVCVCVCLKVRWCSLYMGTFHWYWHWPYEDTTDLWGHCPCPHNSNTVEALVRSHNKRPHAFSWYVPICVCVLHCLCHGWLPGLSLCLQMTEKKTSEFWMRQCDSYYGYFTFAYKCRNQQWFCLCFLLHISHTFPVIIHTNDCIYRWTKHLHFLQYCKNEVWSMAAAVLHWWHHWRQSLPSSDVCNVEVPPTHLSDQSIMTPHPMAPLAWRTI